MADTIVIFYLVDNSPLSFLASFVVYIWYHQWYHQSVTNQKHQFNSAVDTPAVHFINVSYLPYMSILSTVKGEHSKIDCCFNSIV